MFLKIQCTPLKNYTHIINKKTQYRFLFGFIRLFLLMNNLVCPFLRYHFVWIEYSPMSLSKLGTFLRLFLVIITVCLWCSYNSGAVDFQQLCLSGKFLNDILAVLALPRGSQNMYLGMMNCMKPQCRYTRPLLSLETGIPLHFFLPFFSLFLCTI